MLEPVPGKVLAWAQELELELVLAQELVLVPAQELVPVPVQGLERHNQH